jgi:hypothetical protein
VNTSRSRWRQGPSKFGALPRRPLTLAPRGEERSDASINISLIGTPTMSDAKARAAARRQAILAGKSDRLAKLTTKAKNEGDTSGNVRNPTDGQLVLS